MKPFTLRFHRNYVGPTNTLMEKRRASATFWVAVLVGLGLHGFWLVNAMRAIPAGTVVLTRAAFTPYVAFMDKPLEGSAASIQSDVRVVGSPVIFSLPMPVGFSKPQLSGPAISRLPDIQSTERFYLHEPELPFAVSVFGESKRTLVDMVRSRRNLSIPDVSSGMTLFAAATNRMFGQLLAYWEKQPGMVLDKSAWLLEDDWAGAAPWETAISLCVDEGGYVSMVLVEKPTPHPAISAFLARACRALNDPFLPRNDCGRLIFVYKPATKNAGIP